MYVSLVVEEDVDPLLAGWSLADLNYWRHVSIWRTLLANRTVLDDSFFGMVAMLP
jgi:hypothetical protein